MLRPNRSKQYKAHHSPLPFQLEAVLATRDLPYAALFHEQGLGKTKIALDLAMHWLSTGVVDSVLIVTKKGLVPNWQQETKFHTSMRTVVLGQDRKANFYSFNRPCSLYISHYEVMHSERGRLLLFARTRRLGVILDESQRIKNPESRAAVALHKLSPLLERRVILTGTPVANRPYDIWSQIYFLDQGKALSQTFVEFKAETNFNKSLGTNMEVTDRFETNLSTVWDKIRPFTIRETKQSAELNLPDKIVKNVPVALEGKQARLYEQYRNELAAVITVEDMPTLDDAEVVLKRLLRLVQVASNPLLVDQGYKDVPSKFVALDSIMHSKSSADPKTIVWTNFKDNIAAIADRYPHLEPAQVHGALSMADRESNIWKFRQLSTCRVLIATPGAAKEGLTLTEANHAVFVDRNFSLDDYLQAQDRIHRISQTEDCVVENLVAVGTVDEWVGELLAAKQLAASLVQGDIDKEGYLAKATYAFNDIIASILNTTEENNDQ